MEITRDQLAEALYQKGLALADIESLKVGAIISVLRNFVITSQVILYDN